jgi:hypothetical protein
MNKKEFKEFYLNLEKSGKYQKQTAFNDTGSLAL